MTTSPSYDEHRDSSTPAERVLSRLDNVKRAGGGWTARCPVHDDRDKKSLSIGEGDDSRALLNCFVDCEPERIVAALGLTMADLFLKGGGGASIPHNTTATAQHSKPPRLGCTLAHYATAKRLPIDKLRAFGLSDISYQSAPAVRIPYRDAAGTEAAVRFRVALDKSPDGDDRFRWKSGAKVCLYGRDRLALARERGYAVLVEGESDCHTLWVQGEPAIGIPGAALWRDERDAPELDGIPTIYAVAEPDQGGDALTKRLAKSRLKDRVRLVRLGEYKDPSGLYLADPDRFLDCWQAALADAVALADVAQAEATANHAEAWAACQALAHEPDILARVAAVIAARGVAGETRAVKLLYLILVSRLFPRPVSASVKGPSSGGKSFLVDQVLALFSERDYYALSAMSERALAYSEEPLSHRFLVLYEAAGLAGDFASYLVRSLLSEGRVRYETVEKTKDGLKARMIEREGPTGLLVTTTAVHLHPENETRMLSIPVSDTPEHTREIMRAIARGAAGTSAEPPAPDLTAWHALQTWLDGAERRVSIPYAELLSEMIPPVAVRLRRDFSVILTLIRAHACLHQTARARDTEGRILATLEDYGAVRLLVADLVAEGVEATVPSTVRETVETVGRLLTLMPADEDDEEPTVSLGAIAKALKLDKGPVSRRVSVARDREYLRNLETRKGRPARIALGDPLPGEVEILPAVAAVADRCRVAVKPEGIDTPSPSGGQCCVCHGPLAPDRTYLCEACASVKAA